MLFNSLAIFAKLEVDLLRTRAREGMPVARANGRIKGSRRTFVSLNRPSGSTFIAPVSTQSPSRLNSSRSAAPPSTELAGTTATFGADRRKRAVSDRRL